MKAKFIHFFKLITIFLFFLINNLAFSFEAPVLIRDKNFHPQVKIMSLPQLENTDKFEDPYFKIVLGESENPITINDDPETVLKAATLFHHLYLARNFFIDRLGSNFVKNMDQMTIRIDMTRTYHPLGHFAHINTPAVYNDALSIMESPGIPDKGIAPWGKEIWFRPPQKVHLRDLDLIDDTSTQLKNELMALRQSIHLSTLQRTLILMSSQDLSFSTLTFDQAIETTIFSIGLESLILGVTPLSKVFSRKWYWLDSAMVPEIIYHEFSHQALSSTIPTTHSGPVIEGLADYFSSQIASSPTLASKIKKYNTFSSKSSKKKNRQYSSIYEQRELAHDDLTFAILFGIGEVIGDDEALNLIYQSSQSLNNSSKIRSSLLEALLQSCKTSCSNPQNDYLKLLIYFNTWGI